MAGQANGGQVVRPNQTNQGTGGAQIGGGSPLPMQQQTRADATAGLDYAFQGGFIDDAKRQQMLGQFDTMQFQPQVEQAPAFGASDFAQNILQHSVGLNPFEKGSDRWNAADVNQDGKINLSDANKFLRYQTGLETAGQDYDYGSLATAIKPKSGGRGETAEQYEARDDVKLYNQRMNPVAAQTGEQVYNDWIKNNPQQPAGGNPKSGAVNPVTGETIPIQPWQQVGGVTPLPGGGITNRMPAGFTGGGGGRAITPWTNSVTGETWNAPNTGFVPPSSDWQQGGGQPIKDRFGGAMMLPPGAGGLPRPATSSPSPGTQQPANINTLAAEGIKAAGAATGQGLSFNPQQVSVAGSSASVNPTNVVGSDVVNANVVGSNVNPTLNAVTGSNVDASLNDVSGTNVTGSNIAAQQVGAQASSPTVMAERLANTDMSQYMNPYTDQVIAANETDTRRAANMGLDMLGAQAQAAGGFGGSRHGIAMGEIGRGLTDTLGRQSAGLRQAGFQNAQQMAGQDISNNFQSQMANQQGGQFDVNTNMQGQLANQGASLQASQQNQQNALQAQGMNQQNALQARLANQSAGMQGQLANQGNALQSQGMNQQYGMQGQLANQGNALQAALANQSAGMQSGLANQGNALQAAGMNQSYNMQGQLANQQAGQQDIQNRLQAALANQSAGLSGNQQRLGAANQLGNISNLGFNMGQTVNNNLSQQGAMQQALQQAIYDNAQNKFAGYTGQPGQSIGYLGNALGVTPNVGSETLTSKKGLFDYLTLAASMRGR